MAESINGVVNARPCGDRPDDRRRIPSDRRRAGQMLAQFYPVAHVAKTLGVEKATVERWKTEDVEFRNAYFEEEHRLNNIAELCRTKILIDLPDITDNALAVARDTSHRDFGAMSRYLMDKVLIPQSIQHINSRHDAAPEFWEQLDKRLASIKGARRDAEGDGPLLLMGSEAATVYGAASLRESADEELAILEADS